MVLQHAESAVRLLPLNPHGAEQHAVLWGELPPTLPLAQQEGEEAAASLRWWRRGAAATWAAPL